MFNTRLGAVQAWGGDTTQMVETGKALQHLGVEVEILADEIGCDVSRCDLVHLFNLQTAENGLRLLASARAARKPVALSTIYWDLRYARHPDNLRFGDGAFWAKFAGVAPKMAMLLQRVRQVPGQRRQLRAQRRLLLGADVILPNSVAELEGLVAQFGLPQLRARAVIVPNAVSPPTSLPADGPSQCTAGLPEEFVLMAASFHPIKGQARLIEAMMDEPQIPLICVGRSKDDTAYGRYCQKLAAQRGNTYLLDAIPHQDMPLLYSQAKVHALPSARETTGLVSLEAAVHGANCVVGIHAPVQEYFGTDCFVCDPMDPLSLRGAVLAAWNAQPTGRLRDRILRDFTWPKAAEETLRGYQWVLQKGGGPASDAAPPPRHAVLSSA